MFEKSIEALLENCKDELLESKDKKIQKDLKIIKKMVQPEKFDFFIKDMLKEVICTSIMFGDNGEGNNELVQHVVEHNKKGLEAAKKSLIIEVSVRGQKDKINRVMEVPYFISVADLAYFILATFEADANHLFQVSYKDYRFNGNGCDEMMRCDGYADNVGLHDLRLRKNSKLELWYDFGDDYWFDVKVLEIKDNDKVMDFEDAVILDGNGYGIWEDAHYMLDLFLDNKDEFYQTLKENGMEADWFPVEEEFDLDVSNEMLVDKFYDIAQVYQPKDEYFLDDEAFEA